MATPDESSRKILIGIGVGVLAAAIAAGLGATKLTSLMRDKITQQEQDRASTRELLDSASQAISGKELKGRPQFPDTPMGRGNAVAYDMLATCQQAVGQFTADIDKLGWAWVLTADSMKDKKAVLKSLAIVDKVKVRTEEYREQIEAIVRKARADMTAAVGPDPDAKSYAAGFSDSIDRPGSGLYYSRRILDELRKNQDGVKDLLTILLKHAGRYTVDSGGSVTFSDTVPDRTIEAYNALIEKINGHLEKMTALEKEGQASAKRQLDKLNGSGLLGK